MSHDCVLTVSLSCIAKCLFCAETLAFPAEGPFTLLNVERLFVLWFHRYMFLDDNCTLVISQSQIY